MGITSWYTVGVNCSYWRTYQWDGDPTAIEVCASHLSLAASCQHYVPQLPRDWIHLGGKGGGGGGRGGGNLTSANVSYYPYADYLHYSFYEVVVVQRMAIISSQCSMKLIYIKLLQPTSYSHHLAQASNS